MQTNMFKLDGLGKDSYINELAFNAKKCKNDNINGRINHNKRV